MKNFWVEKNRSIEGIIVREMSRKAYFGMTVKFFEVDISDDNSIQKGIYLAESQFLYREPKIGDIVRVFKDGDRKVAEKIGHI